MRKLLSIQSIEKIYIDCGWNMIMIAVPTFLIIYSAIKEMNFSLWVKILMAFDDRK